ncbi:alpha/beta fold hydrolase [Sinomonas humi]|uniref:alpha/beta fold hydrolase n=1 Tax=Sinomonas humi TaxID=1338436 RepID=UPI00068DCD51|nr:alpha/beta hydrolase [Sinomonas humi]
MNRKTSSPRPPFGELHVLDERHGVEMRTGGDGERAFALVHGIGASSVYFGPLAHELARHARVYLLELPGHGRNLEPRRALTMAEFAETAWSAFDRFGVRHPVIVGHSMGCQVAVEMGIQRSGPEPIALLAPTVNTAERSVVMQGLRLAQDTLREPREVNRIITNDYFRCGAKWWLKTLREMMAHHIEERIGHVERKVLLVGGEKDPIAPPEWLRTLASLCRAPEVAVLADQPHVMMYTRPEEVARLLLDRS